MNYGWTKYIKLQAKEAIECLGGGDNALNLILETCATETGLGKVKDTTLGAGMGICQFDKMPFEDIRDRSSRHRDKILEELGVDIKLVEWEHLRYNSFLRGRNIINYGIIRLMAKVRYSITYFRITTMS